MAARSPKGRPPRCAADPAVIAAYLGPRRRRAERAARGGRAMSDTLLELDRHQHVLRPGPGAFRSLARGRARPDRLPARRQRQRQVDHHEGDPRPAEAALGRRDPRRRSTITGLPTPQIIRRGVGSVPEARRLFGAMTVRENLLMGAYHAQRQDGDRAGLRAHDDAVPAAARARSPSPPARSRAASSRWSRWRAR